MNWARGWGLMHAHRAHVVLLSTLPAEEFHEARARLELQVERAVREADARSTHAEEVY